MVEVTVNGSAASVDGGTTVADVVRAHVGDRPHVAVAVNGEVVPRGSWPSTTLSDGDGVEILEAVAGG